ncbi:MAG: anaerobic ribonucleoside-triphosphate reductase activating protein [Clostridia bacterium]|nr:anaerobic ribonucleoside-triphosphate reductase activating protein [Clostridia bacterium]
MKIRIAGIVSDSVVDGPGVRYTIFTQGCPHHCQGCHNPQTWDPKGGEEKRIRDIVRDIKRHPFIQGITLSGGDPFLQAQESAFLAKEVKEKYNLNVVTYTGYLMEELLASNNEHFMELLKNTDILVDGPYMEELRDLNIQFRGSTNQRLIDVPKTLKLGKVVEWGKGKESTVEIA